MYISFFFFKNIKTNIKVLNVTQNSKDQCELYILWIWYKTSGIAQSMKGRQWFGNWNIIICKPKI